MVIIIHMDDKNPNMKNFIRLGGNYIKMNINDSKCLVAYPNLKYYKLLGYGVKEENDEKKVVKDILDEDTTKIPDNTLYFKKLYLLKAKQDIINKSLKLWMPIRKLGFSSI